MQTNQNVVYLRAISSIFARNGKLSGDFKRMRAKPVLLPHRFKVAPVRLEARDRGQCDTFVGALLGKDIEQQSRWGPRVAMSVKVYHVIEWKGLGKTDAMDLVNTFKNIKGAGLVFSDPDKNNRPWPH
jgi:hypothetical protein